MSDRKPKPNYRKLSVQQLETLIDQGSEQAAKLALKKLIGHLYLGEEIPYEYRFRLAMGLHQVIGENKCAELLNSQKGIAWLMSNPKFETPAGFKPRKLFPEPKPKKGRRPADVDENLSIYLAVMSAKSELGRLRDSRSGEGAFTKVARQFNLSWRAIENRYRETKKILENFHHQ